MSDSPELIRLGGRVQGVGFRPTVWQLANQLVGVLIALGGNEPLRVRFSHERCTSV